MIAIQTYTQQLYQGKIMIHVVTNQLACMIVILKLIDLKLCKNTLNFKIVSPMHSWLQHRAISSTQLQCCLQSQALLHSFFMAVIDFKYVFANQMIFFQNGQQDPMKSLSSWCINP